jgi:signal transduction histidine kinase
MAAARLRLRDMSAPLDYPRLLPGVLVPDHGRPGRTTRDWVVDVLCFLLAVFIGLVVYGTTHDRADSPAFPDWFIALDLLSGAVACIALWWRRRWPLGLALALTVVGTYSSAAGGASIIALFTLAVHRPFRVVAPVVGLAIAVQPAYLAIFPSTDSPYGVALALAVLIIGLVVIWGMFVRSRRQLVLSLRDRAERAETEQQLRVEQARQQERARIAREMHDVLAHRISLLSLHAGALEFRPDAPPEEVARAAGVIRASAHEALEDLRAVIGVLRDGSDGAEPERPQPTLADLPALIEESRAAGMRVAYAWRLAPEAAVPEALGRNAYRIVQEGLTNARKHAQGSAVDVAVEGRPGDGLTIEVRNRLPVGAFVAAEIPGAGSGIVGLAERASLAGGRLEHGRTDAGDYRLWAWLPWP